MNIRLRSAVPDDWKAIQALNNEVIINNTAYDEYLYTKYAQTAAGEKYYKAVTSDPAYICIIAEDNGIPVGYTVGSKKDISYRTVQTLELNDMGVTPAYQSQGIGALLIAELRKRAKQAGYDTIYVNAYYKNDRAIEFYKKQGFHPIDISLEIKLD